MLMVVLHGFAKGMNKMVMGDEDAGWWGAGIGLGDPRRRGFGPRGRQHRLSEQRPGSPTSCSRRSSIRRAARCSTGRSRSQITPSRKSRLTSGSTAIRRSRNTPAEQGGDETYERLRQGGFADYRLEVSGHGRGAALAVARRPAGDAPSGTDHDAQLHPGLDRRWQVGRGARSPTSSSAASRSRRPATWSFTRTSFTPKAARATTSASTSCRRGCRRRSWPTR